MSFHLPESYAQRMRQMLGEEYPAFLESFDRPVYSGMRINTLKWDAETFRSLWGAADPVAWCPDGFYVRDEEKPSKHPYYYAGLYYLQEPSAMTPAAVLPVQPGDRVLDLCAAPGGKSTQLLTKLKGQGLLVSNDISPSRAKALLKNLELFGGTNYAVVTEAPFKLASRFQGFFDKILVDAPCSGEGMFHKEPSIVRNWEQYGNAYYANLQREILHYAAEMLRPGGQMVYSTCTFAPLEDEQSLADFLTSHPEMHLVPIPETEGFDHGHPEWVSNADEEITDSLRKAVRLWPHKVRGEGHFVALLEKQGQSEKEVFPAYTANAGKFPAFVSWYKENLTVPFESLVPKGGRLRLMQNYLLWEALPEEKTKGIRVLRSGLLLGECRGERFEPSQAFAMALKRAQVRNILDFACADENVLRYLRGETLTGQFEKAWYLVCVDGFALGWAKGSGTLLKNKYLKGWRYL